jgi:hypothetical protein
VLIHHFSRLSAFLILAAIWPFAHCQYKTSTPLPTPLVHKTTAPITDTLLTAPPAHLPLVNARIQMNGLTMVAPPEPFPENPMLPARAVGANWIAVVPYGYTRLGTPHVYFDDKRQWWGERPEGVRETIRLAHAAGIRVMLKPQVYVPRGWTGALDFPTDYDWETWEKDYTEYLMRYLDIATAEKVELFCIGTEFANALRKRPQFWLDLIEAVRQRYSGKLTYSSNWDDWPSCPLWPKLDYIGLGGYYPLVDAVTPSVDSLREAWKPIATRLRHFSQYRQKPVIFTEFGYLSVDGCGWRNWELESGIEGRNINHQAQSNCYEAFFSTFRTEPWFAGCFLWKWFPNMQGHEGYPERDYTPQGKLAEKTLAKWYKGF